MTRESDDGLYDADAYSHMYRPGHPLLILLVTELFRLCAVGQETAQTVYGLGGDGLNRESSKKIYAAKGRPSDNPLIVHICKFEGPSISSTTYTASVGLGFPDF